VCPGSPFTHYARQLVQAKVRLRLSARLNRALRLKKVLDLIENEPSFLLSRQNRLSKKIYETDRALYGGIP
jgi:hypothetical protein